MPVIVLVACGFPVGLVAGLLISWSPWTLAPLAAVGAFVLLVNSRQSTVNSLSTVNCRLSTLLTALAAGTLWARPPVTCATPTAASPGAMANACL